MKYFKLPPNFVAIAKNFQKPIYNLMSGWVKSWREMQEVTHNIS